MSLNKVQLIWERGFAVADRFSMVRNCTLKLYTAHSFNPLTGSNTETYTTLSNIPVLFAMSKTKKLDNTRLNLGDIRLYIKTADIPNRILTSSDLIVDGSNTFRISTVDKDGSNAVYILTAQVVGNI